MPSLDLKYTAVWYIAECKKCQMRMPFGHPFERNRWADAHGTTVDPFDGETHDIHRMVEIWED
jgi:hypothetical protein